MATTTTTTTAAAASATLKQLTAERLERFSRLEADYEATVGSTSVVTRPDLLEGVGMVITYASTSTYMLESRASGDGRFMHRVNLEHYAAAADIPDKYRKARAIAARVESADAATLIFAKRSYDEAYAAWRQADVA